MSERSTVAMYGVFVRETEKAVCLEIDGSPHWIPKSHLISYPSYGPGEIEMTEWIAKQKDLFHDEKARPESDDDWLLS